MIESELLSKRIVIFFGKGYTENWSREIFIIDSGLKNNSWIYEIKDLNGEKMIRNFCEKGLLRSIL